MEEKSTRGSENVEMVAMRRFNDHDFLLVLDKSMLYEGPPDLIESPPWSCREVGQSIKVHLLKPSNDSLERRAFELFVVGFEAGRVFRSSGKLCRWVIDDANSDSALFEPFLEILIVGVVLLAEDENGVHVVSAKEQRLVCRDRG